MDNLFFLDDYRASRRGVKTPSRGCIAFDRKELSQLMAVYSQRVATGEWRDYAINQNPRMAVFTIFEQSRGEPLYAIAKLSRTASRRGAYVLYSGPHIERQGQTINEVLTPLEQ